jgi:hypothetical protein
MLVLSLGFVQHLAYIYCASSHICSVAAHQSHKTVYLIHTLQQTLVLAFRKASCLVSCHGAAAASKGVFEGPVEV